MRWFYELCGWQQALLATTFTWAMTALGAALVFLYKKVNKTAFVYMMSGAAGIMLASSIFSLLIPALETAGDGGYIKVTAGFLLGGLTIILCDLLTERLNVGNEKSRKTAVMCTAVTVHNIPEGMAVGVAFGALNVGVTSALMLALGVGVQNFPEGMCVAFPLRANGAGRFKSFFIGQLSGAVEIAAGVTGALAVTFVSELLPWALSYSAGAMIAVVCSELIPESYESGKNKATFGIIAGFAVMMILDVALG